jgi:pentose-5-phosphate-3-epimerase/putative flippase GtrA
MFQNIWLSQIIRAIFRYRHVLLYVLIGFFSILLEIIFTMLVFPVSWPEILRLGLGWGVSVLFAAYFNIMWNYKVQKQKYLRAVIYFGLISGISLLVNNYAASIIARIAELTYPTVRLIVSGSLFFIAYSMHQLFTFRGAEKKIGVAIYINEGVDIQEIFIKLGLYCDYLHIDLLDSTVAENARPVEIKKLEQISLLWPRVEMHMHLMTKTPLTWIRQSLANVDVFIIHVEGEDDTWQIIEFCKNHNRQVGIVWNRKQDLHKIIQYFPHVDYVMILGISMLGVSGQTLHSDAIEMSRTLDRMSEKYNFKTIFDGGVNTNNACKVTTQYVVSSSAILDSAQPKLTAMRMKEKRE